MSNRLTRTEFLVMDAIDRGYVSPEEIAAQTSLSLVIVKEALASLESRGKVRAR